MKRVLKWAGLVIVVLAAIAGGILYSAFAHNRPIVDGQELPGAARTVKDGFVSVFVLDAGAGKVALVDAGNDKSGKAILAELSRRGLQPSSVAAIFLTHGHPDHTAACKLFPNAQVYAMANEAETLGNAARITQPLKDGDVAHVGSLVVEAFATPGHTPGSAVYFSGGVLFFGDSAGGNKDGTMMPAVRLFSKDAAGNVASLKALANRLQPRAAEVKTLAFAHSGPLDGFGPLAAFASSH
jgi:glyoxylase-like metal-dependent hydrolase (beta-lactamase superfamily II)